MQGNTVRLDGVEVTYPNGFTAVHPTDLEIHAGEFFSILGPSGCGKTTILRAISGFVSPSAGRISIGGNDMRGVGPNKRPTALIFQNLALFPLMSVWENVAFGMEMRGMDHRTRRAKAQALLDLVALPDQAEKKPGELSGGQRQRVAIARALAVEPAVLLLDEPLSALDLKLRQHMRAELRSIQQKTGVTFIYITHDQGEALTMSDRIAVMNAGRIEQVGSGDEIYGAPATSFAASFVGETNMLAGEVAGSRGGVAQIDTRFGPMLATNPHNLQAGETAMVFVRPEDLRFAPEDDDGWDAGGPNVISAAVVRRDLEGPFATLILAAEDCELRMHLPNYVGAPPGATARLCFEPDRAIALPAGALARTGQELAEL